ARGRLLTRIDALWHGPVAPRDRAVPDAAGRVRCRARAAVAIRAVHDLSEGASRLRDGAVRLRSDGRPGAGPRARRLAHRELQLALCLLYQFADRTPGSAGHDRLPTRSEGRRR